MFPNPSADGMITVQLQANLFKGADLRVFNLYGELIISHTIENQGLEILDLSGESAGIYVIHIATDQGSVTKRIAIF